MGKLRPMKIITRLFIFVLLLPLLAVTALYLYGAYMTAMIERRGEALKESQEALSTSGNGLGGEPGMKVIASDHHPKALFWMDNDHLIFSTAYRANAPKDAPRNFIWNVVDNEIKPIAIAGGVICFSEGRLYHARFSDTEVLLDGRKKTERFQSTLEELGDRWEVKNSRDLEEVWPAPSDSYRQIFGRACKPWFELRPGFRTAGGGPDFRIKYLPAWNWVLRLPPIGHELSTQGAARGEFGFFEIEEEFYAGQPGVKVADLPDIPPQDLDMLRANYMPHLDVYLLTLSIYNSARQPYTAMLNRDGSLIDVDWDQDWKEYIARPVLSHKGLLWSGRDYRLLRPDPANNGSFIRISGNRIYKYLHGSGFNLVLSPDGCRVGQSNRPMTTTGLTNVVVFDICDSIYGEIQ